PAAERERTTRLVLDECTRSYAAGTEPCFRCSPFQALWFPHHQYCTFPHQTGATARTQWPHHEKHGQTIAAAWRSAIRSPPGALHNLYWRWFKRHRPPLRRRCHGCFSLLGGHLL